ncbi:MAG: MBL fold metallo-hydrolase [Patescibacteria group bacterium]|nr:MBL fold metallo-hydrolase [Patescibacteria group bacterium]
MEITYFGNSCFRIKGKKAVVLVGADSSISSKLTADVICVLENGEKLKKTVKSALRDEVLIFNEPGEYEVSEIGVLGIDLGDKQKENIGFILMLEGLRIAHLGNLSEIPTEKQIQIINGIDILLLPVGGGEVISPDDALKLISSIEPDVVVPMSYLSSKSILKLEDSLDDFLKTAGVEISEPLDKLVLSFKETEDKQAKKIILLKDKSE